MLVLLIISLLIVDIGHALQCITNCSVGNLRFGQTFRIPDGQCQQRISASDCSAELDLRYDTQTYSVAFGNSFVSRDFIYITSGLYLSYSISYRCSKSTDCVVPYIQNRIDEMIGRAYDAGRIYRQIAPFIENPSRNGSIQCYNDKNEIVICSSNEICTFDYDQRAVKFRSRGCRKNVTPVVSIFDGESYSSFDISCARSLCNDNATLAQIKIILANNGLTDSNGRRVAAGTKGIASTLLLALALISVIVCYL